MKTKLDEGQAGSVVCSGENLLPSTLKLFFLFFSLFDSWGSFGFLLFADDEEKFVACTCNVGDSLAYVYSPSQGHVREITQGSHDIQSNRDMRDALGKIKIKKGF